MGALKIHLSDPKCSHNAKITSQPRAVPAGLHLNISLSLHSLLSICEQSHEGLWQSDHRATIDLGSAAHWPF